jgi:CheY-like chemotaxis protein
VEGDHKMKIIIIDDMYKEDEIFINFSNLLYTKDKNKFEIEYAKDGIVGWKKISTQKFDIIILDQEMGGGQKDGTSLLKRLEGKTPIPEIIFITGKFNLIPATEILNIDIPISFFIEKNIYAAEMLYRAVSLIAKKIDGGQRFHPNDLFGMKFIDLLKKDIENTINTPISGYLSLDQQKQIGAIIRSYLMSLEVRNYWEEEDILQLTIFFIEALCGIFKIPSELVTVIRKFLDLEEILYSIPRYRDHFFHQVKVFLLGFCIINELNRKKLVNGKIFDNNNGMKIWFLTSVFHDIGYPFEKINNWLNSYFESVLRSPGDISDGEILPVHIDWGSLLGKRYHSFHLHEISRIICDSYKKHEVSEIKSQVLAELLTKTSRYVTETPDHGLYSSIILQNFLRKKIQDYEIDNICVAVALHNDQIAQIVREALGEPMKFDTDSLSFMLAYCDLAQDWGRIQSLTPSLSEYIKYGYPLFNSNVIFDPDKRIISTNILFDKELSPVEQNDWKHKVFTKFIQPLETRWKMSKTGDYHIHFSIKYSCRGAVSEVELDELTI